jgi:Zn finger protein HypA/HybF involved in hydrogenase expression
MTKDEALKMAIKEMTDAIPHLDIHFDDYFEAINACKEALEQPAQDYVLICKRCGDDIGLEYVPDEQPAQECKWCKSREVNFDLDDYPDNSKDA